MIGVLAVLASLVGVLGTILFMIAAWRAMRAHEDIAETLREKLGR